MVMLSTEATTMIFLVFDERGRPLGRVERPAGTRVLGRAEGTVLLLRHAPPMTRPGPDAGP